MKTVVAAPQNLWEELSTTFKNVECVRVADPEEFAQHTDATAFFNLFEGAEKLTYQNKTNLTFINCISHTLIENNQPGNIFRLNAWNGFLSRNTWEIAGHMPGEAADYFTRLGKKIVVMPDVPGFLSCRIISMIINEAYFTLEEGVSTKNEIDVAMKLGTNYPKGPFEWEQEIGLKNIFKLLNRLSKDDVRYMPAPLLMKECTNL